MSQHHAVGDAGGGHEKGVEQDLSILRFAYKEGRVNWELRSDTIQHGSPKVTLVVNLAVNGIGEIQQTFPLSHDNQFQVVMWLARQLGVELPSIPPVGRRSH